MSNSMKVILGAIGVVVLLFIGLIVVVDRFVLQPVH